MRAFSEARDWGRFHDVKSLTLTLVGEVGEVAELVQWLSADEAAALGSDNRYLKLRGDATVEGLREARARFGDDLAGIQPSVSAEAVRQLKFGELLPPQLATSTLAARAADHPGAAAVARTPIVSRLHVLDGD